MRRASWWPAWEVAMVLAVTALAAGLRFNGYGQAPLLTDNADELNFAWGGLNLITHGDAYTWSRLPAYSGAVVIHAYGTTFPMVHHWMDHPPGFSLLIGAWLWLIGARDMFALTAEQIRVLPVVFAVTTVPLGYLAARRVFGVWGALFGAVLLATAPGAVLLSRQAEAESLLAPLLLVATLLADSLAHCGESRFPRWQVALLLAVALLAPTLKITGLAVGGVAAAALVVNNRPRLAAATLVATVAGGLVYPLYGWLVDWRLFQAVVHAQSLNRTGMLAAYELIAAPAGINRSLHDGWWLLGWIALGGLLFAGRRSRGELLLAWPAFAYALVMVLLAGEVLVAQYGWYRVMLMPQVMLAAGGLAWRAVAAPALARLAAVLALGGATATNWWLAAPGSQWVVDPVLGAVILSLVLVPTAVTAAPRLAGHRPLARALAGAAMLLLAIGNVAESLQLTALFGHL